MNVLELPGKILRKVFGTRNDRLLKRYGAVADKVFRIRVIIDERGRNV